jgi:hypothetical protein
MIFYCFEINEITGAHVYQIFTPFSPFFSQISSIRPEKNYLVLEYALMHSQCRATKCDLCSPGGRRSRADVRGQTRIGSLNIQPTPRTFQIWDR